MMDVTSYNPAVKKLDFRTFPKPIRKPDRIGGLHIAKQLKLVGLILKTTHICSGVGFSWQGPFFSAKSRQEPQILCFCMFWASYKDNSGRE